MRLLIFVTLLGYLITGAAYRKAPLVIEKISATMISRQVQSGKSVTIKGELFYQHNGNMVTHFYYPRQYFIIANRQGEIKIYDPSENTVILYQNFLFSTQSSQFFYFFSGKSADMGLSDIGFEQEKIFPEKNLVVSEWKLKRPDKKALIQRVKLVYQGQQPVYMHYEGPGGNLIRKVFYYNYGTLENSSFPYTTTEIVYENGDSTVTKTTYADFRLNAQASGQYFDFKVPYNAKIQK